MFRWQLALVPSSRCLFIHAWIDHRQLGATLQIDSSTCFYSTPASLAKTKRAASFFVPHQRDWIEFTRVRSLRCTLQTAIFEIARELPRGGTLERLLYIYYWSAISQRGEANNGDKVKNSLFLFRTVCAREIKSNSNRYISDLSRAIVWFSKKRSNW